MLANDEYVDQFVGGTVYQAFLSATNYHRWHTPVAGTIVRAFVQGGDRNSEADSEGADAVEPKKSQSYLAHVAARAIILIEVDDPVIGLVAFVPVGVSEVVLRDRSGHPARPPRRQGAASSLLPSGCAKGRGQAAYTGLATQPAWAASSVGARAGTRQ